jgi:hypothetical protein
MMNGPHHSTKIWINKQLIRLQNDFANWIIENISGYTSSPSGVKKVKQAIAKIGRITDPIQILDHYNAQDNIYHESLIMVHEEFANSPSAFKKFLKSIKVTTMKDYCTHASLKFPYKLKYKHTLSLKNLDSDFAQYTGFNTNYSQSYHDLDRKPGLWIFEPDNSVEDDTRAGAGIELVSPPMEFQSGMESLDTVWNWAKGTNITTNNTTGMHVGISIPNHELANIDYVKLVLFLGDNHILKTFNRVDNEYALSILEHLKTQAMYTDINLLDTVKAGINRLAKNVVFQNLAKPNNKYITVNIKNNYIEFRAAGGDYLSQKNLIMNTIARYIKAMAIAVDPEAEKEEYSKKLYGLLSANANDEYDDDQINVFVRYAAGELTKKQVKSILKDVNIERRRFKDNRK